MKVILLQDIKQLGHKYDVKEVTPGYASNYLFPRKLAMVASEKAVAMVSSEKQKMDEERKVHEELLAKNLEAIGESKVSITGNANEEGHLYAQIHRDEIVEALKNQTGLTILPDFIHLEEPIKQIGDFNVPVSAHGKKATLKVTVERA